MELTPAEKFVRYALGIGAIELLPEGRKLKSGRLSPYFFNSGLFDTGEAISHLAKAYAVAIIEKNLRPEIIFGPAYKGIPLAVMVAATLGGGIKYCFNRKEVKDHGEGGLTVGAQLEGKRVLIVDDVITTGNSISDAVATVRARGGIPIGCYVAFDRQEQAEQSPLSAVQQCEKYFGIPVYAVATLTDLISFMKKKANGTFQESMPWGKLLGKIRAYQNEYGVK